MAAALNRFGTVGQSANMYNSGQFLGFQQCWNDEWDDGEEPPHRDIGYTPIEEFSEENIHPLATSSSSYDEAYELDPETSAEDLLRQFRNMEEYEDWVMYHHDRYFDEIHEIEDTADQADENVDSQVRLTVPMQRVPDEQDRQTRKWMVRAARLIFRNHGKNERPKAVQCMPWWRRRPGCRRTIRRAEWFRETITVEVFGERKEMVVDEGVRLI